MDTPGIIAIITILLVFLFCLLIVGLIDILCNAKQKRQINNFRNNIQTNKPRETEAEMRNRILQELKLEQEFKAQLEKEQATSTFQNLSLEEQKKALEFINLLNNKK